jgi:hypothetical protein
MPEQVAMQSYATMTGPAGFTPKAELDVEGVRRVLELRSKYGEPKRNMIDPTKYYVPDFYRVAINS